ncbi:MAG: DsbE family thiol:disulfide interchange protein [Pseudomonadota bacterium]
MAKVSPLMVAPPLIFAGLALMFFIGLQRDDPDALPSQMEGRAAPAVTVTEMAGFEPLTDVQLREGGVKILNYWASWCAPCRVEHPTLMQLAEEGIPIYGVNYKDESGNAAGFLEELGDPYTAIGADADGRMALDWGVYGVPETYVIDADGTVLLRFPGPVTQRVLTETIRPVLDAAQTGS